MTSSSIAETRKLAAVMFTDMVGFSRRMHVDEDLALRLLDLCNEMLADSVSEHGGRILKKMGDAILADFSSAATAVTCAIHVQTRLRDYNADKHAAEQIVLRIGIHLGDMIVRGDDLYGDGVNVAARLEPLCEPGGICLSEAVYQAIGANAAVQPIRVGEVELKNILQKQVIYRIPSLYGGDADGDRAATYGTSSARRLGAVDRIDVLPPPSRGPAAAILWSLVIGPLAVVLGVWTGAAANRQPYRIWVWEMTEPAVIVQSLKDRTTPAHEQIWESLDRRARDAITAFDASLAEDSSAVVTYRTVRRALNDLVGADRPILEGAALPADFDSSAPISSDRQRNRLLLEAAFPGSIRRHIGDPSTARRIAETFSTVWVERRGLAVGVLVATLLLDLLGAYFLLLRTLRISFKDIRDVDVLLDYHIPDLGFRAPERKGDDLVFRASLWTFLTYNILRLRARVAGNTVVLTGPAPMMRRLRKRLLLMGEAQPA
jgi:class 3 adenylate cyclase